MQESNQISTVYNVIISKVDEHNLISIMQHFTEVFSLEREPAEQILKSAPIVFLQGLDKDALRMLKGRLIFLSKMGVEFTIVTHLPSKIPCVVWSGKVPNYTESSTGELIKFVDFQWSGNAFICPNCAETFVFKRIGNPLATSVKFADDSGAFSKIDAAGEIQPSRAKGSSEEMIEAQPVEEFPEDVPVSRKALNKAIKSKISQEEAFLMEDKPQEDIGIPEPILEPIPELIEEPIAEPTRPKGRKVGQVAKPIVEHQKTMKAAPSEKANCSVFLISIPPDKKAKVSELIAKLKGVSIQQAQGLTTRSLVTVLKDVTKSAANNCLEEFKKIGVRGRITVKI